MINFEYSPLDLSGIFATPFNIEYTMNFIKGGFEPLLNEEIYSIEMTTKFKLNINIRSNYYYKTYSKQYYNNVELFIMHRNLELLKKYGS